MKKTKRFVVLELKGLYKSWSVEDTLNNKTKAVFYDEASKQLAEDFCKQINKATERGERG